MADRVPVKEGAFVEDAEGGRLVGNRCNACGKVFFPRVMFCLSCFAEDVEDVVLSRRGKLYSYTIGRMPTSHFQPPYALGYVVIQEGVRVFAPLKMKDDKPLHIGMEMQVSIEPLWTEGDQEIIGYKFEPV